MKKAIIIFTRVPIPGQTKTRMMPVLSPKECARLHQCFLKDIYRECVQTGADLFVCFTPENQEKMLIPIFGQQVKYVPQQGEGLGERMYVAIERVLQGGYDACILIGTDIPELRHQYLERAFAVLEKKDVVFGPTKDGGYYLVGMKTPRREVFEKQTYGHASVLENVVERLKEAGISYGYGKSLADMDVPADLYRYRRKMRSEKWLQKTETGKYLMRTSRISIIIPVYNEESTILSLQKQLDALKEQCEIIFVDGGSTDRTLKLISEEYQVYHSEKGRAKQMNLGAQKSHGEILFFLHCDSELPEHALQEIRSVMKDYRVGCFGIAFHSKNFFMLTCQIISNHRIKDRKVMFGDQGIFIDRNLFFETGMFPEIPIMEDYQFSLELKRRGEKIGMTRRRIYTSDRRFPKGTIPKLRLMWKMNRLRKRYRDGEDIGKIAGDYLDVR